MLQSTTALKSGADTGKIEFESPFASNLLEVFPGKDLRFFLKTLQNLCQTEAVTQLKNTLAIYTRRHFESRELFSNQPTSSKFFSGVNVERDVLCIQENKVNNH